MFIRASLIQQMFFTDNRGKPSFTFSMKPEQLSKRIKSFTLNLEGQIVQATHNDKSTTNLTWPGNNPGNVTLHFSNHEDQNPTTMTNGVWAWFRLLDTSNLQPTNNPKQFLVNFSIGNSTATFNLVADNKVNPYLPDILSKFICPDDL